MEVLREGSIGLRVSFTGRPWRVGRRSGIFSDLDCHSLARPRIASRISWGVFGFNRMATGESETVTLIGSAKVEGTWEIFTKDIKSMEDLLIHGFAGHLLHRAADR